MLNVDSCTLVQSALDTLKMKDTAPVEELNTYKDKVLTTVFLSNFMAIHHCVLRRFVKN